MSGIKILRLFGCVLVAILSACGPATTPTGVIATQPALPATMTALPTDIPTAAATLTPRAASDNPTPIAVATSRGPNLEATNPATVQLASDTLQLVEFFRFT